MKKEVRQLKADTRKMQDLTLLENAPDGVIRVPKENSLLHFACSLCSMVFSSLEEQKKHYKSEMHLNKLKEQSAADSDDDSSDEEDDGLDVTEDGCLVSLSLESSRITVVKRLVESGFNDRELAVSQLPDHLDGHFCVLLYRSGFSSAASTTAASCRSVVRRSATPRGGSRAAPSTRRTTARERPSPWERVSAATTSC